MRPTCFRAPERRWRLCVVEYVTPPVVHVCTRTPGCKCVPVLAIAGTARLRLSAERPGVARPSRDLAVMGKRGRRRVEDERRAKGPVWQTARVRVDDETWAEYRRSLGERSVAEALALHVEREVAQWRRRRAAEVDLTERDAVEVLERVEAATETLKVLASRLEFRLRARER